MERIGVDGRGWYIYCLHAFLYSLIYNTGTFEHVQGTFTQQHQYFASASVHSKSTVSLVPLGGDQSNKGILVQRFFFYKVISIDTDHITDFVMKMSGTIVCHIKE